MASTQEPNDAMKLMANLSDKDRETIDSYVKGNLTQDEETWFESNFINRPEVIEVLELDMIFREGLPLGDVVSLDQAKKTQSPKTSFKLMPLAATVAMLSLATSLIFNVVQHNDTTHYKELLGAGPDVSSNLQLLELFPVRSTSDQFEPVGYLNLQDKNALGILSIKLNLPQQPSFTVRILSHPDRKEIVTGLEVVPAGRGDLIVAIPGARLFTGDFYAEVSAINEPPMLIPFRVGFAN